MPQPSSTFLGPLPDEGDVWRLLETLFPLCRSITGDGVRQTHAVLRAVADFETHEVPSGTQAYDWTVPDEWNIRDAYVADEQGRRLIDFRQSNLHVVGYSMPVDAVMSFAELDRHLHSLPLQPNAIPYRTAYYTRTWGFALSQRQRDSLDRGARYRVVVDAVREPGFMTYADRLIGNSGGSEYLISSYSCHPSLANDNLSGMVLWALLLRRMAAKDGLRNRYRFVLIPETIGSALYLARNEAAMTRLAGGYVLTCVAGPGPHAYKRSFLGSALVDLAAQKSFADAGLAWQEFPFDAGGSDERNYSAPFFRIPTGTICKSKYYTYDEYHTSLDDLSLISPSGLLASLALYERAIEILESERPFYSRMPFCEPMLGRRGLYPQVGGAQRAAGTPPPEQQLEAIRWIMHMADGNATALAVAQRAGLPHDAVIRALDSLVQAELISFHPPTR